MRKKKMNFFRIQDSELHPRECENEFPVNANAHRCWDKVISML